jgi:hypothetical protein
VRPSGFSGALYNKGRQAFGEAGKPKKKSPF